MIANQTIAGTWLTLLLMAGGTGVSTAFSAALPAATQPDAISFWEQQGGAANIGMDDLSWITKSALAADVRKLLNDQALPNIASLCDLLHRDVLTTREQARVAEIWRQARPLFEEYAAAVKRKYAGEKIHGEPVVNRDGRLGFILPLDLDSENSKLPMPPALKEAFLNMIQAGGHAGIKGLVDAGQIDLDANKLLGKIRNDIHELVMARLVEDCGHPVHADLFSLAELGRSDLDLTLGKHVAFTWLDEKRQSVGTDGDVLTRKYRELFGKVLEEKFGARYGAIRAADLEIVCHDADARLPDPVLFHQDNAKFTAVLRARQRKLMDNPEAYFFEGAYRCQPDRRGFESERLLHSVYRLRRTPSGEPDVIRSDHRSRTVVFQFLPPELRKPCASGEAMNQWIFWRRHKSDSSLTTLMDTSRYPLRVADEAVALKAEENLWTFGGVEKMTANERRDLLRKAFSGYAIGDMPLADAERVLATAVELRAASKGNAGDASTALRPFEEAVLQRIVQQRGKHKLTPKDANRLRREFGAERVAEMGRAEFQAQAERFMLNVVVEALPDRINDYLNPDIGRRRLEDIVSRRVHASGKAIARARQILEEWKEPTMRERYRQLAEIDLAMIGVALRHYAPEHHQGYLQKLDLNPEVREHFERLLWQEDVAAFVRAPLPGGAMLLRSSKYQAVKAMQTGWESFLSTRKALGEYAGQVRVELGEKGSFATAGKVFSDVLVATGKAGAGLGRAGGAYAKWGSGVLLGNFASEFGVHFPDLDASLQAYRTRGPQRLALGRAQFSFKDFVKANVGLGQVDSVLNVLQAYQQEGQWNDRTNEVLEYEIYSNIPGFGAFYATYKNLTAANMLGIVMQWAPVYASYAYGETVAAAVASPLIAVTVFNITYKLGTIWSYHVFDSNARALFFGVDPVGPDAGAPASPASEPGRPPGSALDSRPAPASAPAGQVSPPPDMDFVAGPPVATSSADPSHVPGAPIDPGNPIAAPAIAPQPGRRIPGLLDIVPGKTLADRKLKLYEWMETYAAGGVTRPYSVMQTLETETRLFEQKNLLLPQAGESIDARRDRLKRAAQLEPKLTELQAAKFQEALDLECRALAVEFLRGDLWQDKLFGPMREEIRAEYGFWLKKPDVLEHLVRLIQEHYILGMHAAKGAQSIEQGRDQTIDAQEIWAADEAMRQLLVQVQAEANNMRAEQVWSCDANPAEPEEMDAEALDRHLTGTLPGLAVLKEGRVEVTIKAPQRPWPVPSIDSISLLQLEAQVKAPAHKFKRPYRYEWKVGGRGASRNELTGLATMKGELKAGQDVPVSLEVFDLLDRPVGSATTTIKVAPPSVRFRNFTLYAANERDKVYQSETLATDLKIAADHGYVLGVELEMLDPAGRFEAARIGLLPASIVRRAEGLLGDPAARLSAEEMRHIDPKSLVPTGLQYLRGELARRAKAFTIPAPKDNKGRASGPQKAFASSKCQREPNVKEDEYCLLAIVAGSRTGRHFLLAPHQIVLRRADIPRVEWTMAKGRHEFVGWDGKWYMGDVDLLKHKSDGPFGHVFHGRKGEVKFSVVGSTGGQRPALLEIGVTPIPRKPFFPNARRGQFQRIGSSMTELSPGKFVCEARWQTSNAVPGHLYEFSVRMRMPTPDATYYRPEYLEVVDVLSDYLTEPSRPKPGQAPAVQPPAPKAPASKPVQAAPPAKRAGPKPG